jgi:thioredoxin 2
MIVKCQNCGQKNRVPGARLEDGGKCGKCGETLEATGRANSISAADFDDLLVNSPLPVLVDFWAPWCGPCRMVAPEVEKLAAAQKGDVLVVKLNTQEHPSIAQREGVRGIPMFGLYRNGQRVGTATGYMDADALQRQLGL